MSSRGAGVCIFRASPYRKCAWWNWRRPFPSDAARNKAGVINGLAPFTENRVYRVRELGSSPRLAAPQALPRLADALGGECHIREDFGDVRIIMAVPVPRPPCGWVQHFAVPS